MNERFVRQRRNIINFSIVLFFIEASKISFDEINILGNKFNVGDPEAINYGLWIALFYFLIRYYQYFNDLEESKLGTFYSDRLREYAEKVALKKAVKEKGEKILSTTENGYVEFSLESMNVFKMGKSWNTKINLSKYEKNGDSHKVTTSQNYEVYLSRWNLFIPRFLSFILTSIKTKYFTEYILPFIIFLVPVIYKVYSFTN